MSSTNNSNNRGSTLKSLADLGSVIDVQSLPPEPDTTAEAEPSHEPSRVVGGQAPQGLAGLLAELSSLSGGLESMARQDARAREQATIDLALGCDRPPMITNRSRPASRLGAATRSAMSANGPSVRRPRVE